VVDLVVSDGPIPWDLSGETCGYLRHRTAVEDFAYAQGRATKPKMPLMLYGPDNYTPIVVVGDGVTEAAEMQDLALGALDKQEETYKKVGRGFDFDDARERAGMVRREDFGTAMAEAFAERVAYLKAHQVTEPQGPHYERRVW
jgi:hypothetical protein